MIILRWMMANLRSLILALTISVLVWVAAVSESDPLITQEFPESVSIEYRNNEPGYLVVGDVPLEGTMTLRAPSSVWDQLKPEDLRLVVDLTGLQDGEYTVDVYPEEDLKLVRVISYEPTSIDLTLKPSITREMVITPVLSGEPAIGYITEMPLPSPDRAMMEGPSSAVERVQELIALVDVTGRNRDVNLDTVIVPVDALGAQVPGVIVTPATTTVQITIVQQRGFRSVAVVPIIEGDPAPGYWVKNVTYSPTAITLVSSDPQAVDLLPGYVETEPVVLTGARETIERTVRLSLAEGFSVIGDPSITLVVTIEPLETSITITRALEISGLDPGLTAEASPDSVSVFIQGPQPTLDELQPEDVIVVLDLLGYGIGTHQVEAEVLVLLEDVEVQAVLPETIEVTITIQPTPTPAGG
jgi:YbbR domain-containing protein